VFADPMTAVDLLRVLILEDQSPDADLMRHEVLRAWPAAVFHRADDRDGFMAGLLAFRPDVVLSDHSLPRYTGSEALALTQSLSPETPFIMVTGSLDEETAVECIKSGAADYVLKENLLRLVPAVRRALEQARARRAQEAEHARLRGEAERYRQLIDLMDAAERRRLEELLQIRLVYGDAIEAR
jgi:DNA-binding NtrC family response regulator